MTDEKSNEPPQDPQKPKGADSGDASLTKAAWLAFGVMVVFVIALLVPDCMNYNIKKAILAQQRLPPAQTLLLVNTNIFIAGSTNVSCITTNVFTAASSNIFFVTTNANTAAQSTSDASAVKPGDIYETYAKLITMLLGFISVVGIIFGYFVRRQVRELIEDIRRDVELEMKHIRNEHDIAQKQTDAAQTESATILKQVDGLRKQYMQLNHSATTKLEALDAAIKRYQDQPTPAAPKTSADVTNKVNTALQGEGV